MEDSKIILQDNTENWKALLPLTYTKPISYLRIGIDTLLEKWQHYFQQDIEIETEHYLMAKFQNEQPTKRFTLVINSSVVPSATIIHAIKRLQPQQNLEKNGVFIARKIEKSHLPFTTVEFNDNIVEIRRPWHIFQLNKDVFLADFERLTSNRQSQQISNNNQLKNSTYIFVEEGAEIDFSILDASKGPIYIGKNAKVLPGCMIMGGLALGNSSILKMGAKIYGATTIGPFCKIGGEVKNVVVQGYSNKGHDGYLGNAVLGEWCNIGADTNASNLKNNYGNLKVWSYLEERRIQTNEKFIGLIMGDHSKSAINTMFNTASIVGIASNIFGAGFPKTHIPSFTWGGVQFHKTLLLQQAFIMAENMMSRKKIRFNEQDKQIFTHIFEETKSYRT